jgi:GH15 family glucan-1,4-alpha-glucosidase
VSDTALHELGLLGDGCGSALVRADGTIEWCCLPRFDSGSCFGALLDGEQGGFCSVELDGRDPERGAARYADGSLVHVVDLAGGAGRVRVEDALAPGEQRLARVVHGLSGRCDVVMRIVARFDYGQTRPWLHRHDEHRAWIVGGDDALIVSTDGTIVRCGDHELQVHARVGTGERLQVSIASCRPEDAATLTADARCTAASDIRDALIWTRHWWADADAGTDDAAVVRSALTLKALVYERTGAVVAAPTTSLTEALDGGRTWDYRYAWVRDATWTSRALAALGITGVGDAFSAFVMRASAGHADDMQVVYGVGGERRLHEHEVSLAGWRGVGPVRVGNAAEQQIQRDEAGEILQQCRYRHERGHRFDDDEWRFITRVLDRVARHWHEPDRGFWELRGEPRQFVYSKAACFAALDAGLAIAAAQRPQASTAGWHEAREAARETVLDAGFEVERGVFRQAVGRPDLDAIALLLPHTGVVEWTDPRMHSTADVLADALGEDGLLRRYDTVDGLPGREGCFLACSFWLAECLAHQGRLDAAARVFKRTMETASPLGLFSEEYDTRAGVAVGNYPQALTHLAHVSAAVALGRHRSD